MDTCLIDCDSSQIEARVLAWLAGQDDLTEAFRVGDDVYKKMAMSIYGVNREEDVTKDQRFVGKTTILGAGYGMGAVRLKNSCNRSGSRWIWMKLAGLYCYSEANFQITTLWRDAESTCVEHMARGGAYSLGLEKCLQVDALGNAIILPSGLHMRYDELAG